MNRLARTAVVRYANAGTSLLLMGIMWLYLWVFPWHGAYLADPHYLVRLPGGTYEQQLVTRVYDGMLIVLVILALMEGVVQRLWGVATTLWGFGWGMLSIVVALLLLAGQPETRVLLGLSLVLSALAGAGLVIAAKH